MTKIEQLVNEACDAMELARSKLSEAVAFVESNDYGDSGETFITQAESTGKAMLNAFISLEDFYAYAEDLVEAP